jgi:uncharacterized DUF497 family protein
MPFLIVIWADGAWEKVQERGLDHADLERVAMYPAKREKSRSSQRMVAIGWTAAAEQVAVVYEHLDRETIVIITAYRIEE